MGSARPYRVLLVDDHEEANELLEILLGQRGFEVACATTVAAALELAEQTPIDVLVSDLVLPDGSGYDLLRALRARSPVPAVAVSGLMEDAERKRAATAGFDAHLRKPITIDQLVDALDRVLASQ